MGGGGRDGVRWRGQWVQVSKRNEISILHHVKETAKGREGTGLELFAQF